MTKDTLIILACWVGCMLVSFFALVGIYSFIRFLIENLIK